MEYRIKQLNNSVKDVDTTQGIVKFAFAHFGSKDSDGDLIQKGAYQKTIAESGPKGADIIYHYKNHDSNIVVGKVQDIYEEGDYGILISKLSKNDHGRNTLIEYQEQIINQHSQGFYTVKEEQKADGNYIREVIMVEASSLTKRAANQNTPVFELKNSTIEELIKDIEHRKTLGFTDEYHKHLESLYIQLKSHFEPGSHSKPDIESEESIINRIINNIKLN